MSASATTKDEIKTTTVVHCDNPKRHVRAWRLDPATERIVCTTCHSPCRSKDSEWEAGE